MAFAVKRGLFLRGNTETVKRGMGMGRLTEYFSNVANKHSAYISRQKGLDDAVVLEGFDDVGAMLGRIMTNNPTMADSLRRSIRRLLKEARNNLSKDAKDFLENDPRKAYRAVKSSSYKRIFGGNLSILQKRRGTAGARYELKRKRKRDANPHMRGGNRLPFVKSRNRLETYYGADRGFILRFMSSGTINRKSRFGNRGNIRFTNWFGHVAPYQMQNVVEQLEQEIKKYIDEQNG